MTDLTGSTRPATSDLDRRTVLRGAAVGGVALPLLAACAGGEDASSGSSGAASPSASVEAPGSSSAGGSGGTSVAAADVPVGGGTILKDEKVVVTQPSKGNFKAFTAVCTHKGCTVAKVDGGRIICPCHGSQFSIKDGSRQAGPAQAALAEKTVTVEGDQISIA